MADLDMGLEYDITFSNVVCHANLGCVLNVRHIAEKTYNVEELAPNKILLKLRKPRVSVMVWPAGKIVCSGAKSESLARTGVRRVARIIQKCGYKVKLREMRIANVMAHCSMPFQINLYKFARRHRETSYEPEIISGANYKIPQLKANLTIFTTGSITIFAPNVANVYKAVEHIYPLIVEFRRALTPAMEVKRAKNRMRQQQLLLQ